jgi:ribonuclease P protein component
LFVVQWIANDGAGARLGMAVGTRAAGKAVNRNRIRRLIRESFRMHRDELPAVDVLVTARAGCARAVNHAIFESLAGFWRTLGSAR